MPPKWAKYILQICMKIVVLSPVLRGIGHACTFYFISFRKKGVIQMTISLALPFPIVFFYQFPYVRWMRQLYMQHNPIPLPLQTDITDFMRHLQTWPLCCAFSLHSSIYSNEHWTKINYLSNNCYASRIDVLCPRVWIFLVFSPVFFVLFRSYKILWTNGYFSLLFKLKHITSHKVYAMHSPSEFVGFCVWWFDAGVIYQWQACACPSVPLQRRYAI